MVYIYENTILLIRWKNDRYLLC
uniref:Uncharacterized protein n=1 Tax=Arundo donax TaxID=35708 RepID=A0A0A9E8J1_ARUDO